MPASPPEIAPTGHMPKSLSASSIRCYLNCPRDYFYKYVMGYKFDEFSKPLVFGTLLHNMLETHFKTAGNEAAVTKAISQTVAKEKMEAHMKRDEIDHMVDMARKMYQSAMPHLVEWEPREVEMFGRRKVANPVTGEELAVPIGFKIDLITKAEQIVDHKSAASEYNVTTDADGYSVTTIDDEDYQLYLYMLIYRSLYGKPPTELIFNVMLKRSRDSKTQVIRFRPDEKKEARAWETANKVLKNIMAGKFEPNPHARWCDACSQFPV